MRLTIKLVSLLFVCVVLAVGINGYGTVRMELERHESDLTARHVVMGHVLRSAFSEVMDTDGEARAVSVLDYTDKRMRLVDVRWVFLDEDAPLERRPQTSVATLRPLLDGKEVYAKADGRLRTYVPVHIEGRSTTALEFSESLEGERNVVRHALLRELRAAFAVVLAVGGVAAVLGVAFVARPMRQLVEHARRIGRGDLSPAAVPNAKDEIGELAQEMNAMCVRLSEAQAGKLKALEQLRHAERLTTMGKLASGIAHELGTPLNVIALRAKAIARGRATGDRAQEAATSIAEQATRMTSLVQRLLDFARRKAPQHGLVHVEDVVRRTTELLQAVATKANVRLDVVRASVLPAVRGDSTQLVQVLTNLLMNAIQASPSGSAIRVAADLTRATPPADHGGAAGAYVRISVADSGGGIDPETLPHIFEPFFTTKEVGEGTGLGLAVCYGIVGDHGGWIDVVSKRGAGAEFVVYLPVEVA